MIKVFSNKGELWERFSVDNSPCNVYVSNLGRVADLKEKIVSHGFDGKTSFRWKGK